MITYILVFQEFIVEIFDSWCGHIGVRKLRPHETFGIL